MRRLALLVITLAAAPAMAASLIERRVEIRLHERGLRESSQSIYLLDEADDLTSYSEHSIHLDDNIELVELEAEVLDAKGASIERVPRRDCREVSSAGSGLHSSSRLLIIPFPKLHIGERLRIRTVREIQPYYPGFLVPLQLGVAQSELLVTVRGTKQGFRWQAPFTASGYTVRELDDGLEVTAKNVARRKYVELAADTDSGQPHIRFTWASNRDWVEVGKWYAQLISRVPRGAEAVQKRARGLVEDAKEPTEKLRRLARYVQETIRYEAVEVGVGGYVPAAAQETLQRGWGDCKAMSELLAEMLKAVGIPAHLTLVRLGQDGRIDPEFPWALQFNHCVVAVPATALRAPAAKNGETPQGGAADRFVFVDPTMKEGGPTWLNPAIQGQLALVEAGAQTRSVNVPLVTDLEGRTLRVDGALDAEGTFTGAATLRLAGLHALAWLRQLSTEQPELVEAEVRQAMERRFPGARVAGVQWRRVEAEVPTFEALAQIAIPRFVSGTADRGRLRPPMLSSAPEPRILENRVEPVVVAHGVNSTRWTIGLPDGVCPPPPTESDLSNSAGRLWQAISRDEQGRLVVERQFRIERAFFPPEELAPLRELALEESRSDRRSLRLGCDKEASTPSTP
jgi:hypothetical protein